MGIGRCYSKVTGLCSALAKFDLQQGRCYSYLKTFIDILDSSSQTQEKLFDYAYKVFFPNVHLFFITKNPNIKCCGLLEFCVERSGNFLPTFPKNQYVLSSSVKTKCLNTFSKVKTLEVGTERLFRNVGKKLPLGCT